MLIVLLPTAGALLGSVVGALVTYRMSSRTYRLDRLKLISSWAKSEEVEKARVAAYRDLWKCLGGVSTHSTDEIVRNLPTVQERLQEWYYGSGGGLFLTGAAEEGGSAKACFFAARDLQSSDPSEIWHVFHDLRRGIRRDLGVFESDVDESAALENVKKKLGNYENCRVGAAPDAVGAVGNHGRSSRLPLTDSRVHAEVNQAPHFWTLFLSVLRFWEDLVQGL
jgi:hypothetical protein